jgi:predicted nucleic acid-binding protein
VALGKARYLADKSALARLHLDPVARRVGPLFLAGEVAICGIVDLELLFSARSSRDYLEILSDRRSLPRAELGEAQLERAIEVQTALARQGKHRGVSIPDLLIAAAAEVAGLIVLHYDHDFDLVAAVTGQLCEWVVARASVP